MKKIFLWLLIIFVAGQMQAQQKLNQFVGKWAGTYGNNEKDAPYYFAFQLNADSTIAFVNQNNSILAVGTYSITDKQFSSLYRYTNDVFQYELKGKINEGSNIISGTWMRLEDAGSKNKFKTYGNWTMKKTTDTNLVYFKAKNVQTIDDIKRFKNPYLNDLPVNNNIDKIKDIVKVDTSRRIVRDKPQNWRIDEKYPDDIAVSNWGFENGLQGWTPEGNAFSVQPTHGSNIKSQRIFPNMDYSNGGLGGNFWKDQYISNGYKGIYWIGTFENSSQGGNTLGRTQGDVMTGTLTSTSFNITKNYCYFLIGGNADSKKIKVEFQIKQDDGSWKTLISKSSFRDNEMMYRDYFDLQRSKAEVARIRIIDSAATGHINMDDFIFSDTPLVLITITDPITNNRYYVDADYPVWGIADTHAHPAHNLGLGEKLIIGDAKAPISTTYNTNHCVRDHNTLLTLNTGNTIFIGQADPHLNNGYPDFIGYPRFTTKTHQQQQVDFLKRAWQGGLRIFCALAINNMYVPSLLLGPGRTNTPIDDETAITRQIADIKNMAIQNASWMEIALTPKDARRIIIQGKLAVVLGVEMDNFGNFKSSSFNWNNPYHQSNPLIEINLQNSEQLLEQKLNHYYALGIRQVCSVHYISGVFGGVAVFRTELTLNQFAFNNTLGVKSGVSKNIAYNLTPDYDWLRGFVGNALLPIPFLDFNAKIIRQGSGTNLSMVNSLGMTEIGRRLMTKMMNKGFIIDQEHMSYDMKEELFAMASFRNYPVISSHTDPLALSFSWKGQPVEYSRTDARYNLNNFGTTNIRNITNEFQLADVHFEKIKNSGGTVGVFLLPYLKKSYGSIPNDCAGSSKTWAQTYLYSVDKMGGEGVALCSDRGMNDFIAPRFGPFAGFTLKDEVLPELAYTERRRQRFLQTNGVRYDVPMTTYHPSFFESEKVSGGFDASSSHINYFEEDAWKAMAATEANVSINTQGAFNALGGIITTVPLNSISLSREITNPARIINFLKGLTISQMDNPLIKDVNYLEKAAMFCVKNNLNVNTIPGFNNYMPWDKDNVTRFFNLLLPVWNAWNARNGSNPPLRRFKTGNRFWDFNTDGMAHYGLIPDFLQDLRNIGLTPAQLAPLYNSAEAYIKMWEKSLFNSLRTDKTQ